MNWVTIACFGLNSLALVAVILWLNRLNSQHLVVAHSLRDLAATVSKLQADQRTQPRAAGAPPVGAFSFKGVAK